MDEENQNVNNDMNSVDEKKDEINDRLPPKKDGLVQKAMDKIFGKKGKSEGLIAKIWNSKFFLKYKLIIIGIIVFIILIIAILIAIDQLSTETAVKYRQSGISALQIDENSSEEDQLALKLFDEYDSLIGFTTEHLDKIYKDLLEDKNTRNKYFIDVSKKEVGTESGKGTIEDKRALYEHIQRTEKYNFNSILWTEFSHGKEESKIETIRDEERELNLPKDATEDKEIYKKLLEMTAPYLLTSDIPLGMLSGSSLISSSNSLSDAGRAEKFVYQIEKEAMTKMKISKYDLQSITVHTYYEDGMDFVFNQNITIKRQSDGSYKVISAEDGDPIEQKEYRTEEKKKDGTSDIYDHEVVWYVREAYTYDDNIVNEYEYETYTQDDVNGLVNYVGNQLTGTDEINKVIKGTQYKVGDTYPYNPSNDNESTGTTHNVRNEYTNRVAEGLNYEKTWKDKVTPKKSEIQKLTYDDFVEYNTKEKEDYKDIPTDKTIQNESEVKGSTSNYKDYTEEDKTARLFGLSLIDFLNSNPGIYEKYLPSVSSRYSKYMGINRVSLKESYTQVKAILKELCEKTNTDNKVPFVYGSSLGFDVTTINGSGAGNYVSGMQLLKLYIRSFEGVGKVPVTQNAEGVDCYTAYMDDADPPNLTVGYGINLTGNPGYKTRLEEVIGGPITDGTLVPCEAVDAIEDEFIKYYYDLAKSKTAGLELTEYQYHALASMEYNNIHIDELVPLLQNKSYWDPEVDDIYEEMKEKYKDNESNVSAIQGEANLESPLYTDFFSLYIHGGGKVLPGLVRRRKSEFIVFTMGYYDTLQRFYSGAGNGNLAGIDLVGSDGKIDENKCVELQLWYEQTLFVGGPTASTNVRGSKARCNAIGYNSIRYFAPEFQEYVRHLGDGGHIRVGEYFQCTWWAESMGYAFLKTNTDGKFNTYFGKDSLGDGGKVARNLANQYGVPLTIGAQSMVAGFHYIISTGADVGDYSAYGHVMYVEAVTDTEFVISHAGGGEDWYGLQIKSKDDPNYANCRVCCLEDVLEVVKNEI